MTKRTLIAFTAIIWLATVTGFYYLVHKPFDLAFARNLALAGWRIVVVGAILSVGGGLGVRLFCKANRASLFWHITYAAIGLGILGTGILLVGGTVGFNIWFFIGLLVILGSVLREDILIWWQAWQRLPTLWQDRGRLEHFLAWGLVLLLFFTLFTTLAPPVKFDALVYHLVFPKTYLLTGRVQYQTNIFWGMPQLIEMLYTWAMALGGVETATLFSWALGFLVIVGLVDWTAQTLAPRSGWLALACLMSGYTLAVSLAWGYLEWPVMLFGLSVLIFLTEWQSTKDNALLLLGGILAGFAFGTKYTAGIVAVSGVVVIALQARPQGWGKTLKNLVIFSLSVLVAALPWLLKNLLTTGNPVYPLVFPAGAMNAFRLALYQKPAPVDWRNIVLLPWQATMTGADGGPGYAASIGPLLLGFGLLGGFIWPKGQNHLRHPVLVVTLVGLIFWIISAYLTVYGLQTRLIMVIFPALAVLAAAGFVHLSKMKLPGVRLGRVASVFLTLVFSFNLLEVTTYALKQGAISYFWGQTSAETYQNNNLGIANLAFQSVNDLPPSANVLMLWETRSFYCLPRCVPDEIVDRWLTDRAVYGSADAILAAWRNAGYTHLLFYRLGADFYRDDPLAVYQPADWQTLDQLLAQLPIQTDLNGIYTLYRLIP